MNHRREPVFHQRLALIGQKAAHHQDARLPDASAAQTGAFLDGADRQPFCAFGKQHARDLDRAVAVGIRLDHPGDFDIGAHDGADVAVIASDLLARDELRKQR